MIRQQVVAREDLVLFINACMACTGQKEFYSDARGQELSLDFLHAYVGANYPRLYARTLAAGINHHNRGRIVFNLLARGRDGAASRDESAEEGALVRRTLETLPPQRALAVLVAVCEAGINNRRTRAVIGEYLGSLADLEFTAVKYRRKLRILAAHAHLTLPREVGRFLFLGRHRKGYETPLFDAFARAWYSREAVYELPFTIAEGFAQRHGIPRDEFLERIEPRMTSTEKLRFQRAAVRAEASAPQIDLGRRPLTRLALAILDMPLDVRRSRRAELEGALARSAARAARQADLRLGRVAAVLDRSWSASGSDEKRRRPLGVALAVSRLLAAASREYRAFWAPGWEDELTLLPRGQTDLAGPLIDALAFRPDLLVLVSDGHENDPPGLAAEVLRAFRHKLDPERRTTILHVNPVFDEDELVPRAMADTVPTVGIREAEDFPMLLGFASFADGTATLASLEEYLAGRAQELLDRLKFEPKQEVRG